MALLVKTLNGLAYAGVKARAGLAVASIKTINGLDATGGGTPSITYQTNASSISDLSSYTFSAQAIGLAADRDYVIVGIFTRDTSTGTTISSVTIGGNSASQIISNNWDDAGANSSIVALYYAAVASGTTADVVVNLSTTMLRCGIGVYTVKNVASMTPFDTGSANSTFGTTVNLNCDTPSGNSIILAVFQAAASDVTMAWTGPTENFEAFFENLNTSGASASYSSAATQTVTGTAGGSSVIGGVSISLQ